MRRSPSPLADTELIALLESEPELLAIADALVQTRSSTGAGRGRWLAGLVIAVTATAFAVVAFVARGEEPTLVERALAAVSAHEVLQVVIETPPQPFRVVDIQSGRFIERLTLTEVWYDAERALKRTIVTVDGRVVNELLETPEGGWTQGGPVYTCAWIAAHPVEATRVGVSCNADMRNGTVPRKAREEPPTLTGALAGFVDRYRSALASGEATRIGSGTLGDREVVWLRVRSPAARPGSAATRPAFQDVAIDAQTHEPVVVRNLAGDIDVRVRSIQTIAYEEGLFPRPRPVEGQGGGNVSPGTPVSPAEAGSVLGGKLLWLGREWAGLRLAEVKHHRPTLTFGLQSHRRREQADVIGLTYRPVGADGATTTRGGFTLYQSSRCVMNVGMNCEPSQPEEGQLLTGGPTAHLKLEGLHVSIWDSRLSEQPDSLVIARALRPLAAR